VFTAAELLAVRTDTHAVAWRRHIGESASVRLDADDRAAYVATAEGRLIRVMLADGSVDWDQVLYAGALGEPLAIRDRVLVGTASTTPSTMGSRSFFALDPDSGGVRWNWDYRHLGGHPIGAAAEGDVVYMAALDEILRALNRSNGNQKWKRLIGTRPRFPPVAFGGIVVVVGTNPLLSAFNGKTGAPIGTWAAPANTETQGAPLIDPVLRPFRTSIVVILRDGQVSALRPTAMMFREPAVTPPTTLPGQPLLIERLPSAPRQDDARLP
jgi:outer membrane protein assembly factor BamB